MNDLFHKVPVTHGNGVRAEAAEISVPPAGCHGGGGLNILYLVHRVPYPLNRGDRIRSFHLLRFLSEQGNVHLASLADEPVAVETRSELRRRCARLAIEPLGGPVRWLRAAAALAGGRTATEGLFRSPKLAGTVERWAAEIRFDVVVVFCSSMMQYAQIRALAGVPVVVDLVDVDSQKWFGYAAAAGGWKRRLFSLEATRLRRIEARLADRAQAITLASAAEVELFRSFAPGGNVHAVGSGVDLEYFRAPRAAARRHNCVFVGALDYRANVDGLLWFCARVWPEVQRRWPKATLSIVGRRPVAAVRRLAGQQGVEVVADVPDVRPHLARASAAVVPLRLARGVQNKVLEALAMSRAVVASPPALEGLGAVPGRHLLQADTPAEWIDSIEQLFAAPEFAGRLGSAGRAYVEQSHSWPAQLAPFGELLTNLRAG